VGALAAGDEDALGGLAGGGPEGEDGDGAQAAGERREDMVEPVGAVDQGEAAARGEAAQAGVEPAGDAGVGAVGAVALRHR
jgi:hypothetical protein